MTKITKEAYKELVSYCLRVNAQRDSRKVGETTWCVKHAPAEACQLLSFCPLQDYNVGVGGRDWKISAKNRRDQVKHMTEADIFAAVCDRPAI